MEPIKNAAYQAQVALLMIIVTLTSDDGCLLGAPSHNTFATPVTHKSLAHIVAIRTVSSIPLNQKLNTIKTLVA